MPANFIILAFCLFLALPSHAGDIILNADKGVEYHQKQQKLVAVGNAVATKDNMTIKADTLTGWYNSDTKNKISRVEAHGNVKMISDQTKAFGNDMIYSISDDNIILQGQPARIITPDAEISAQGDITYYPSHQKAVANNNIIATDAKGNKVYADKMTAYFTKNNDKKMVLDKIDIEQNVKIVSKDATITALKGTYHASLGKITLSDDVVINQNGNILKGAHAETNLNTGVSKILSGGTKERVSGVFKEKKKD